MKAIILAGGQATRLKPITDTIPKVLVPIDGKPLLRYILRWLEQNNINDIVVKAHYFPDQIVDELIKSFSKNYAIGFAYEGTPLGTAGAVKELEGEFRKTFAVIYGDILTTLDLKKMYEQHLKSKAVMTIAVTKCDRQDAGKVVIDSDNYLKSFHEKDPNVNSQWINMGIYIMETEVLQIIPQGKSDFALDTIPTLLKNKQLVSAFKFDGYYNDVGTMERYNQANQDVKSGKLGVDNQ